MESLSHISSHPTPPPEKMEKAAKDFEGQFITYVFDTIQKSIPRDEDSPTGGGFQTQMFQSMFVEGLSGSISQSRHGFGIAESILKQMPESRVARESSVHLPGVRPQDDQVYQTEASPMPFLVPAASHVSSAYGYRTDPLEGDHRLHSGMDFALPAGTPIRAAADGVVSFSGTKGGYGTTVMIRHDDEYSTLYGHSSRAIVQEGQKVRRGEVVGYVGSTGRSTGPHLHFEVRRSGNAVNPLNYVSFSQNI